MREIISVALDVPINKLFSYYSNKEKIQIGTRVIVPFGKTKKVGIVIKKGKEPEKNIGYVIKNILSSLDENKIISKELMDTCVWASAYYHHPIGQVLFNALTSIHKNNKKEPKKRVEVNVNKSEKLLTLNDEQMRISNDILNSSGKHAVHVVRGITGSGKTEIYISLAEKILSADAQVLILVPEINLTPQTVDRFKRYLDIEPLSYHSGLTPAQKYHVWHACKKQNKLIIIGTRSSVFLPFKNLKLVVIDEEHDNSYKQTEMFKYNGRDIGILRGKNFKCPVVLGSATPSFETLHNIHTKKYKQYMLLKKFHLSPQPLITIVDTSIENYVDGISKTLEIEIKKELDKNNKIILFIGRRGFSNTVMCSSCKTAVKCPKCDVFLTYHRSIEKLICHQCEYSQKFSDKLECCENENLVHLGIGTQRIERRISKLFPGKRILRVDSDSIKTKQALNNFVEKTKNNQIDIFIGTQMIVKGHDFEKVSLVGIINIDAGLYSTDFRGLEKTGQLITQVSGRSGRQKERGNVIIQTNNPNHPLLQVVLKHGYDEFSSMVMKERKTVNLPPYTHIAIVKTYSKDKNNSRSALNQLKNIDRHSSVFIYGPSPCVIANKRNYYYHQLLVGSMSSKLLSEHISKIELYLSSMKKKINWNIDIDPIEQ